MASEPAYSVFGLKFALLELRVLFALCAREGDLTSKLSNARFHGAMLVGESVEDDFFRTQYALFHPMTSVVGL